MALERVLKFYRQQSPLTDPKEYARLYRGLPRDIPSLVKVVQNVLTHAGWLGAYGLELPEERYQEEMYLRPVQAMLAKIQDLQAGPLTAPRAPERGLVSLCRDFGVMLVSMLRHQGVPARLRVGFAGYFNPRSRYWDHRIAEFWDGSRWVLVDPQLDEVQRNILNLEFNPLDMRPDAPFYLAGEAWQLCRAGCIDPDTFADSPTDVGLPMVRYALLHDLDALNKVELVGPDAWHELISKPEEKLNDADFIVLGRIAELTVHADECFDEMRAFYAELPYAQAVRERLEAIA